MIHFYKRIVYLDKITKDTLVKEIVNNELIVSTIDIKATPPNMYVFVQDKIVVVECLSLKGNKDELNKHLVKVIVPISRSAKGDLYIIYPSSIAQLHQCFNSIFQSDLYTYLLITSSSGGVRGG